MLAERVEAHPASIVPAVQAVQIGRDSGVVTVTLDRPAKKNAIDVAMWGDLEAAFTEIGQRGEDRAVILTGAGGDFCSGADLSDPTLPPAPGLPWMRRVARACQALHALPQPVIAKVRGVAVGAGLNLAIGCDLVVASDDARFAELFARRGLSIDFGGSWVLPRLVGLHKAKELALLADIVPAEEALRLGIVNRVVPGDELDAYVDGWAARLAAGPPLALAMTKRLLNASFTATLDEALEAEALAQTVNLGTADAVEAMQAYREGREPQFRGR